VSLIIRLLFEDLTILVMAEFIALMVVLTIHRRRMTRRTRRAVWITLACCASLILLNRLVVTDRERAVNAVTAMARAVDDGDVPAIAEGLDEGFQYSNWDRAEFVAELNQKLQQWRVDRAQLGRFEVQIEGDVAQVSFRASCDWHGSNQSQTGVASSWALELVRRPDGWKLRRVVSAKVGPAYAFDLKDVWNY